MSWCVFRAWLGDAWINQHKLKEGSFRVVTLLKIHLWESAYRGISIQQPITRNGRMLSDEFLVDLDYIQPKQRGIRLDFPVVASWLRPVSYGHLLLWHRCLATNSKMSTLGVPENFLSIFFGKYILQKGLKWNISFVDTEYLQFLKNFRFQFFLT